RRQRHQGQAGSRILEEEEEAEVSAAERGADLLPARGRTRQGGGEVIEPTQRRVEQARGLIDTLREYVAAEAAVYKTSEARRALPAGSSRAKATTANARWSTAC